MTYEPGTVAHATVGGIPDTLVIRATPGPFRTVWVTPVQLPGRGFWWCDEEVTDVRPLVVLDLDEITSHFSRGRESLSEVLRALRREGHISSKKIADQIEAQTEPPRIPEPGLWGVVEASTKEDSDRRNFGRVPSDDDDDAQWTDSYDEVWRKWADLIDPVLIRPGIEDES